MSRRREFVMVRLDEVRARAEAAIERLIALLDEIDDDPDLEDDGLAEEEIDHPREWRQ